MPSALDEKIDAVIKQNLKRFLKPGVVSVRPGIQISKGRITNRPAIVVGVHRKISNLPASDVLPTTVDDIPVDVRPLSPMEALRVTDPESFAQRLIDVPRGNVPVALQTPNFELERNLNGELVSPMVDKAVARVRPHRPGEATKSAAPIYQKLPQSTFAAVTDQMSVTCFASPDAGWPTLEPFLRSVNGTLTVGIYEFTAPHIVTAVSEQMAGKVMTLVLDDPDYDTTMREQTNDATFDQLRKALGAGLNFAWAAEGADKHNTTHLFPAAYHIKVAVADSKAFFLSSGNFNTSNQPPINPIGNPQPIDASTIRKSDRDWHVIVDHAGLAGTFETVIQRDLAQAQPTSGAAPPVQLKGSGNAMGMALTKLFPARTFRGEMTVQPVLTPDNYVDVILPLIRGATKSFWMQTQYIKPSSSFAADMQGPESGFTILEQLIVAVRELFDKGVDVRIILGSRVTSSMIEQLQKDGKLVGSQILRQDNVHNKGMIIDGETIVVGSQNWSTEGVDSNRDASVVIKNSDVAAYWTQIFENDWNTMTLAQEGRVKAH